MKRIGCTGHQALSFATRRRVAAEISHLLATEAETDLVGLSSLAEGADQLFALAVLAAGGKLEAIIPSSFYDTTFKTLAGRKRYTALLDLSEDRVILDFDEPSEDAFLAAGHTVVDRCNLLVAVWDGEKAAGRGGTADVVQYAHERGVATRVIWPEGARRE